MSREIVEAMKALAVEKGIAPDRLVHALEDALLSAYKKQPGAASVTSSSVAPTSSPVNERWRSPSGPGRAWAVRTRALRPR